MGKKSGQMKNPSRGMMSRKLNVTAKKAVI
jgi:hypothetical protein